MRPKRRRNGELDRTIDLISQHLEQYKSHEAWVLA